MDWKGLVQTRGTPPPPRKGHTATRLLNSPIVLVFGGEGGTNLFFDDLYSLNLDTNVWARVHPAPGPRPAPRLLHTATAISNTTILVFGGDISSPDPAAADGPSSQQSGAALQPNANNTNNNNNSSNNNNDSSTKHDSSNAIGATPQPQPSKAAHATLSPSPSPSPSPSQPSAAAAAAAAAAAPPQPAQTPATPSPVGPTNETWLFNLADRTWRLLPRTDTHPAPRAAHSATLCRFRGHPDAVYVYGGFGESSNPAAVVHRLRLADLVWEPLTVRVVEPQLDETGAAGAAGGSGAALVSIDPVAALLRAGNIPRETIYAELHPGRRESHAAVFVPELDALCLVAGEAEDAVYNDFWQFSPLTSAIANPGADNAGARANAAKGATSSSSKSGQQQEQEQQQKQQQQQQLPLQKQQQQQENVWTWRPRYLRLARGLQEDALHPASGLTVVKLPPVSSSMLTGMVAARGQQHSAAAAAVAPPKRPRLLAWGGIDGSDKVNDISRAILINLADNSTRAVRVIGEKRHTGGLLFGAVRMGNDLYFHDGCNEDADITPGLERATLISDLAVLESGAAAYFGPAAQRAARVGKPRASAAVAVDQKLSNGKDQNGAAAGPASMASSTVQHTPLVAPSPSVRLGTIGDVHILAQNEHGFVASAAIGGKLYKGFLVADPLATVPETLLNPTAPAEQSKAHPDTPNGTATGATATQQKRTSTATGTARARARARPVSTPAHAPAAVPAASAAAGSATVPDRQKENGSAATVARDTSVRRPTSACRTANGAAASNIGTAPSPGGRQQEQEQEQRANGGPSSGASAARPAVGTANATTPTATPAAGSSGARLASEANGEAIVIDDEETSRKRRREEVGRAARQAFVDALPDDVRQPQKEPEVILID